LVTRTSIDSDLPGDIIGQMFIRPEAMGVSAVFLGALSFTGLPRLPLIALGGGLSVLAVAMSKSRKFKAAVAQEQTVKKAQEKPAPKPEDNLFVDPMELELGFGLIRLADTTAGGDLLDRVTRVRHKIAQELGMILPKVRIRDNIRLDQRQYQVKIQDVPVVSESDPDKIPRTDRIVTQIIPVRFVEVAQLVKDLQPLVSLQTTITANDSGNAVVITDTQANIHRIAEIIHDIDMGAEDFTVVKVFHLNNADPTEMADLLTSLFPNNNTSTSQSPMQVGFGGQFGGFRRFFGGGGQGGAGSGNTSSGTQSQRIKKRTQVTAVADQRTASVVVTATKDLIDQIEAVVTELDANPANIQTVSVINMQNTDPQEALAVLQDIFEKNGTTTSRTANQQSSALTQRSTTQGQQYNSTSRSSMTGGNSRTGIGGSGSIGFGQ